MLKINSKRYLIKNYLKPYYNNKYILKKFYKKKFQTKFDLNFKKRFIYYPIFWKINLNFHIIVSYNAYQNQFTWIEKKFNNFKFNKIISIIKEKNSKIKTKRNFFYNKLFFKNIQLITNYFYIYNYFFYSIYIDIFYFIKYIKIYKKTLYYYLILSFKKNKLFINLKNFSKKNYLSLSNGLFIKFFEKKKSFKKNKTIKLLMAKFIRKIFLISKIKNTILIIKKNPLFLLEMLNFFNSPIIHKFINPIENKIVEESNDNFLWIKFLYFIFLENKNFSLNKLPKKGRIKRKILRKVVFENKIID